MCDVRHGNNPIRGTRPQRQHHIPTFSQRTVWSLRVSPTKSQNCPSVRPVLVRQKARTTHFLKPILFEAETHTNEHIRVRRSTPPQTLSSFACLCAEFGDGHFQRHTTSWEPSSDISYVLMIDVCLSVTYTAWFSIRRDFFLVCVFLCFKLAGTQWTGKWTIQQQDKRDFALACIWRHLEAPGLQVHVSRHHIVGTSVKHTRRVDDG